MVVSGKQPIFVPNSTIEELRKAAILTGALGAVFSVLFLISLWLLNSAPRAQESDEAFVDFYAGDERRKLVLVGLYLLPFSAVAFIWFTAALRQWVAHSSRRGSQLFGTVQLLSGVSFIILTLGAAAASVLPAVLAELTDTAPDPSLAREFPLYGDALLLVFGIRMAAIFVMSSTTLARNTGVMPRWFHILSIVIAIVLFLSYSLSFMLVVVFPLWVLAFGLLIIIHAHRADTPAIADKLSEQVQSQQSASTFAIEE